jgi:hypothetical protein
MEVKIIHIGLEPTNKYLPEFKNFQGLQKYLLHYIVRKLSRKYTWPAT